MGLNVRTIVHREKRLLEAVEGNMDSGWVWAEKQVVSVSVRQVGPVPMNATVTIYTDNSSLNEKPMLDDVGSLLMEATSPATVASAYRVNWVRVMVTNYVAGTITANLLSG